jgi:hypothetical protein
VTGRVSRGTPASSTRRGSAWLKITEPPKDAGIPPSVFFHGYERKQLSYHGRAWRGDGQVFGEGSNMQALTSRHLATSAVRRQSYVAAYGDLSIQSERESGRYCRREKARMGECWHLMPHPERTVLGSISSWIPDTRMGFRDEGEEGWGGGLWAVDSALPKCTEVGWLIEICRRFISKRLHSSYQSSQ